MRLLRNAAIVIGVIVAAVVVLRFAVIFLFTRIVSSPGKEMTLEEARSKLTQQMSALAHAELPEGCDAEKGVRTRGPDPSRLFLVRCGGDALNELKKDVLDGPWVESGKRDSRHGTIERDDFSWVRDPSEIYRPSEAPEWWQYDRPEDMESISISRSGSGFTFYFMPKKGVVLVNRWTT